MYSRNLPQLNAVYNKGSDIVFDAWLLAAFKLHPSPFPFAPHLDKPAYSKPLSSLHWYLWEIQIIQTQAQKSFTLSPTSNHNKSQSHLPRPPTFVLLGFDLVGSFWGIILLFTLWVKYLFHIHWCRWVTLPDLFLRRGVGGCRMSIQDVRASNRTFTFRTYFTTILWIWQV